MYDLIGGNSFHSVPGVAIETNLSRVALSNVVGDWALELINFYSHAKLMTGFDPYERRSIFFRHPLRFNELKRKGNPALPKRSVMDTDENVSRLKHLRHNLALHHLEVKPSAGVAIFRLTPLLPGGFNISVNARHRLAALSLDLGLEPDPIADYVIDD
jgi:hypothetical protein